MMNRTSLAADAIRRRRGIFNPDDLTEAPAPVDERVVEVPVPPEFQAQEAALRQQPAVVPPPVDPTAPVSPTAPPPAAPATAPVAPGVDDALEREVLAAQETDRQHGFSAGLEKGVRQLTAGLTQTPVSENITPAPLQVPLAHQKVEDRRKRVVEALQRKRQGDLDASTIRLHESEIEKNNREKPNPHAGDAEELATFKKVLKNRYPGHDVDVDTLSSMKGAQDYQNALEGDLTRASNERAALGMERIKRSESESDKAQAGAQHLADKAGETQSVARALDDIDATIAKHPADIPGVGKWKSAVPDIAKPLVLSDEGMRVRNDARDVLGTLLHKRSGAAVSPAELARYEQMYGLNGSDSQFKDGMSRIRRDFASELGAAQAGVSPAARQKYKEGGGMLAEDVLKTGKPSPGPGYVRGTVNGKPGWINRQANEWEPD